MGGWDPPLGWDWGFVGMKVEGKAGRAPCAWEWTLEKRSGQRTLPFFPGSELTLSTTSAPPEPTLLKPKGVPGGSHSHARPSPRCSCSPGLLVLCCRTGMSSVLHTGQVHCTQTWDTGGVQAAPRDTSGHICEPEKSCGTGKRGRHSCAVVIG